MSNSHLMLQKQLERTMRDLQPTLRLQKQIEQALWPFRESHLAMLSQLDMQRSLVQATEIIRANDHILALGDRLHIDMLAITNLDRIHKSWVDQGEPMRKAIEHLQASSVCSLASTLERLTVSERLFVGLDFDRWREAFRFQEGLVRQLDLRTSQFAAAFNSLAQSIPSHAELTVLPSFVMPSASREVLTSGRALVEISPVRAVDEDETDDELLIEVREEASGCISMLAQIDPALAKAYRGAKEAFESGNIDRARHVLASLRELWGHLLRRLAPDEAVLEWTGKENAQLVHDGRPTRRARVLFVCREINHEPLSDFVVHDTQALVKMIDFFNRVHEIEPGLTDQQLRMLILRSDSWLTFVLQLGQGSR